MKTNLFFLIAFCSLKMLSQELPPIVKFDAQTYGAGNQNWMIGQNKKQYLYIANNEGLLEYNGADWTLYPSPNETIVRSIKVVGDSIYTGCYMEFGYWKPDPTGRLKYTSLSAHIKSRILDDEQFWNIFSYDRWIVFQSLSRMYIYDSNKKSFKIISPESGILKAFKTADGIFYQTVDGGIYEIENGKETPTIVADVLGNIRVINIFKNNGRLVLQTQSNGFLMLNDRQLVPVATKSTPDFSKMTIYSSLQLSDGSYALGSISNGLFILAPDGTVKHHLTQNHGLGNNTVLSLFEDRDRNLWVGLDNGINCINIGSPITTYADNTGILGTVYASCAVDDKLYVGTNQGLFWKPMESRKDFEFIPGTKGQVWSLYEYDGTLFCGHDLGTFVISGTTANLIFNGSGTWKFEPNPKNPNQLIQGNYMGLSILGKKNDGWKFNHLIPGFSYSSKHFEIVDGSIFVSHEYKGIFKLNMSPAFDKVDRFETLTLPKKGKHASLVKFNNSLLYASKDGVFRLKNNTFVRDASLSRIIEDGEYTSGKMNVDRTNKLWIFTRHSINYFTPGKLSDHLELKKIPIPSLMSNSMLGYENISHIGNNNFLVGTTDGYYLLNTNSIKFSTYNVNLTGISKSRFNGSAERVATEASGRFPFRHNNLSFNYAVPEYNKYLVAEYQYMLEGFSDEWSDWSEKASVTFRNLPHGDYVFRLRARVGNELSENTIEYEFQILRPWYLSYWAIACYILLVIVGGWFIHKAYKSYYQKQKEKLLDENRRQIEMRELENEQQLMRIRNEQLVRDVESKNRELAASTMNLIKKNELLSLIKEDLKKTDDSSRNIKTVISTINKNISEEDTWDLFKEAFNNADKDFLKKIKQAHPTLTPNDLRLCAYLRLNLSSKEIAPLLNISVRSVEIKRYRLRKKMDLPHEQGLVEYILGI